MIRFLSLIKESRRHIAYGLFFASLFILTVYSSIVDNTIIPNTSDLVIDRPSDFHSASYQKAVEKSRNSAVRLISIDSDSGMVSTFSGTYVKSYGSYFVVTVAHGMAGPCEYTKIVYNEELYDCIKIIEINDMQDYAVIQVGEIAERTAVKVPQDIPRNKQWRPAFTLLNEVVYTGYPNNIGPLSIGGKIAGANGTQFIYLDSYAWEGSSGAGVFDSKGKYIGYVVAIDVGGTDFGVQVLNNIVLVIPAFKIDWTKTITEAE
jgi:hypothetical protein